MALLDIAAAGSSYTHVIPLGASPGAMGVVDPPYKGITDAMLDTASTVETGVTVRGLFRLMMAYIAGNSTGMDTGSVVFKGGANPSKTRITGTIDSFGNRSSITVDTTD